MKEVIFHCGRYPSLVMTVKPFGIKDSVGNMKPAKHLHFRPDPELGAGILRLTDEEMVSFVRKSEAFKSKKVIEVTGAKDIPAEKPAEKVTTGVHTTADVRTPSGEPKGADRPVKSAKVPGRK